VFPIPIEEAIEADELPTVTALAERGKQHISIDRSGKSGLAGIHPTEPFKLPSGNDRNGAYPAVAVGGA